MHKIKAQFITDIAPGCVSCGSTLRGYKTEEQQENPRHHDVWAQCAGCNRLTRIAWVDARRVPGLTVQEIREAEHRSTEATRVSPPYASGDVRRVWIGNATW